MWKPCAKGTGYLGSLWLFSCLRVHQQEGSNDDLSNYWYEAGGNPRRSLKQSCLCYRGLGCMGRLWADGWNWWQCTNQNPVESTRTHQIPTKKESPNCLPGGCSSLKTQIFPEFEKHETWFFSLSSSSSPPQKRWGFWLPYFFWILWDPLLPPGKTTRCATGPSRLSVVDQRLWAYERKLTKALKALRGKDFGSENQRVQWAMKTGARLGCLGWK